MSLGDDTMLNTINTSYKLLAKRKGRFNMASAASRRQQGFQD